MHEVFRDFDIALCAGFLLLLILGAIGGHFGLYWTKRNGR